MKSLVPAIEICDVSKKFNLSVRSKTLKDVFIHRVKGIDDEFWALRDVNIKIFPGETVGLLGSNGSGKSTLLKMINRILFPTNGSITRRGKVIGLLELGAGFKPDYTGKENIYLNGSILGYTKNEIDEKFDQIVEFSELDKFIYQPVRNYSSGMYMRLAYSVAINSEPDILLIDEVLAVGDKTFKEKGLLKILELKERGTTIILVSHSESMIKKVCNRSIWLHKGRIIEDGRTDEVIKKYANMDEYVGGAD